MPYKPTGNPPGRPRKVPLMDDRKEDTVLSPAAQAEIDRRVDEKMSLMLEALQSASGASSSLSSSDSAMAALLESFAQNMAAISSQANGKTVVTPAIKKLREQGFARMMDLIEQASFEKEKPRYGLHKTIQLNTHDGPILLDPVWQDPETKKAKETVIEWPSIPCDAMRPMNDIASAIYAAFRQSNTNVEGMGIRERAIGVTAKGRVVYGSAVHLKEEVKLGDQFDRDDMNVTPGFQVVSGANHLQRTVRKHVLGTTAEPHTESAV